MKYIERNKALELLKKAEKLQAIVRLIGPDALPDYERLVLVVAEMIKNGFLQQRTSDIVSMDSTINTLVEMMANVDI